MEKRFEPINCPSRIFNVVAFDIDPVVEDEDLVNELYGKASKHGADSRDTGGETRDREKLLKDRYIGNLSEDMLVKHLQTVLGHGFRVYSRPFVSYSDHVDIEIEVDGRVVTTVEVRSSFLFAPRPSIVCRLHGVIGPYSTTRKPDENPKDFYLYAFINKAVEKFVLKREHTLYFASGAPYQMILEKGEWDAMGKQGANYLLIKPMVRAMDAIEVVNAIRRHASEV